MQNLSTKSLKVIELNNADKTIISENKNLNESNFFMLSFKERYYLEKKSVSS
jgi:hypothetical protein